MSFKSTLKKAVSYCVKFDLIWKTLNATFLQLARFIEWEHHTQTVRLKGIPIEVEAIERFCPDFIVKHGPFAGLKYPSSTITRGTFNDVTYAEINPVCGNLFPKLIGSYESELHTTINTISNYSYSEIINVGCAEGYYTVGFALKFPEARIYAYDIKQQSQEHCLQLAQLNHCEQRIEISDFCSPETLLSIPISSRGLIICDCEGYEAELFSDRVIAHLKKCDLLIELHDFIDLNISNKIKQQFADTHEITIIKSLDDLEKARTYPIAELKDYDLNDRRELLRENRTCIMDWVFLTPLSEENSH
ncbi:hypothetical protein [Gimesia aquarii]|uniref:Uncharacterized protein n=1 Tax=Gimesia aquarii TaxID=2527964 RepID=A0A517VXD1_9PLAN|nr:hypothetical protein [Gimesia aquarii]QDT97650.1 hypothetical protein V144x_31300 [Gimesia aquarii]